jgi:hypothetical protein
MDSLNELEQKIIAIKKENEIECLKEIEIILYKYKCSIICNAEVLVNGNIVKPVIKSL